MKNVTIRGDGVAAYCCAHLLNKAGLGANLQRVERPRLPVIMLGDQALALIRDIFDQKELFAALPRIQKRVVAWGPKAEPLEIEHSAVVVSEESLLKGLRPNEEHAPDRGDSADTWTIFSSKPLPAPTQEHSFGSRIASAVAVTLTDAAVRSNACYIESLDAGWLFLIPRPPASNWLLAVGDSADALLARSRVIAPLIARFDPARATFPAYPRLASPLCGPGWLACGTAAMAFDPICGDGTAHAIREAILAAAVIRAIASGEDTDGVLSHYGMRLTAGFGRHLLLCRGFYASGGSGSWWTTELAHIEEGIHWCDEKLSQSTEFRYQLNGFELHAVR